MTDAMKLCPLCKGTGNLVCFPAGKPQWWTCSACGGKGTNLCHIAAHRAKG